MVDILRENDQFIEDLRVGLSRGEQGLSTVPMVIKNIIKHERWRRRRIIRTGQRANFDHFEQFVTTQPLEGLGTSIDMLLRLCKDDREALEMIDGAMKRQPWRPSKSVDNVHTSTPRPSGNSQQR